MGNLYEKYQTDPDAEIEGVWVDFGDGIRMKIARMFNERHNAELEKLRGPYKAVLNSGGEIPEPARTEIAARAMAVAIIKDWEGVEGDDGKPQPYTAERGYQALLDLRDLRNRVAFIAGEMETFRKAALDAAAGNFDAGSSGGSIPAKSKPGS